MIKRLMVLLVAVGLMAFMPMGTAEAANSSGKVTPLKIEVAGDSVKFYYRVEGVNDPNVGGQFNVATSDMCPQPNGAPMNNTFTSRETESHIAVSEIPASELGPNWRATMAFSSYVDVTAFHPFNRPADERLNFTCGVPNATSFVIYLNEDPGVAPPPNYVSDWGAVSPALKTGNTVVYSGPNFNELGRTSSAYFTTHMRVGDKDYGERGGLYLTSAMSGEPLILDVDVMVGGKVVQSKTVNVGTISTKTRRSEPSHIAKYVNKWRKPSLTTRPRIKHQRDLFVKLGSKCARVCKVRFRWTANGKKVSRRPGWRPNSHHRGKVIRLTVKVKKGKATVARKHYYYGRYRGR